MPRIKKRKTLVSDFDYLKKLSSLREEVPAIAHNLYPLYAACNIHIGDYWNPKSVADLEQTILSKIDSLEERENLDEAQVGISSGGIHVSLYVEGKTLFAKVVLEFGYELL